MEWSHLLLLSWITLATATNHYIKERFKDATNNGNFTHLVVHKSTGKVYIGAVNSLYALSDTLTMEKQVNTGPEMDNPNCPPPPLECICTSNCDEYKRKLTDSISKALVIDYTNQLLIACTNLFQGRCEKRHLDDISRYDRHLQIPLVPNDYTSPAVIFIAPGPSDGAKVNEVLYIGATRSTVGLNAYKDLLPTVSSRNLSNFQISYQDLTSATKKELEYQQRDTYKVYYVASFASGGFSYFLTIQRETLEVGTYLNWVTRLVRVCQNDKKYYSYAEVPLTCSYRGAHYNILRAAYIGRPGGNLARSLGLSDQPPLTDNEDVLFALFSKSQYQSFGPTNDSVLCLYPLRQIRRIFTEIIQDCFNGVGNTGPPHIVSPQICTDTKFQIGDNYCGQHDFNNPIAGTKAVEAISVYRWEQTSVTSIIVMVTNQYTVAFIGTKTGNLKKVVIESGTSAKEYENVVLEEGSPVNPDMAFDRAKEHVYVMTHKQVLRVKVQECSQYMTCDECLGAKDPFCGWCVLEKKCGKKTECENSDHSRRWLPYSGTQCTSIQNIIPPQVQIKPNAVSRLTLTIQNLPSLTNGGYECAFTGYGVVRTTVATVGNGHQNDTTLIMCETPYPNLLPIIPTGRDHIIMQLSVRMNGKDFVSRNFTFFDCAVHYSPLSHLSNCTSCTKSDFPCTWCVQEHTCTSTPENCRTDILITGEAVKGKSDSPGPQSCPRFESSFTEILVPSDSEYKVKVRAVNLQEFQTNFKCRFNIEGKDWEVPATQDNSEIECDTFKFLYQSGTAHLNIPFKIFWGNPQGKALDNPDRIQVKVYKCEEMADNCGECLTVSHKYNCGWCHTKCSIQRKCSSHNWLNSSLDCPNPKITQFMPRTGPLKGGTRVTIDGENLGKVYDDIKAGVQVAGQPCEPDPAAYKPAQRVVCITGVSDEVKSGKVAVTVRNHYSFTSSQEFSYVRPVLTDFSPTRGPQSGGTRLTIAGEHMNTGTNTTITVARLPCSLIMKSESTAVCMTSPSADTTSGHVVVHFDRASIEHPSVYKYVLDPNVTGVYPLKVILSGGMKLTVTGTNLDSVQDPKMLLQIADQEFVGECSVRNSSIMLCRSPNLKGADISPPTEKEPVLLPFGFLLDNVTALRSYTQHHGGDRLAFYPDPVFTAFKDGTKRVQAKEDDHLTINGQFLNLALTSDDVVVKVGSADCVVTTISSTYLICTPPGPQVEGVGTNPRVTVHVGANLTHNIGSLKYESMQILPFPAIIGIGAGGGILVLIIIIVCIAYRQKSRESDRVMKRMQNQMDVLEARVAKECKEAFAELQTDMTELTSDLSGPVGIPFRDYRSFCMHVLFPLASEKDHPVMRPLEVDVGQRDGIERGLRLFNHLVLNKTFLLLFIRTLESHKDFSMRERVNVASLISVALQGRMEHHTDILKTLLADLIERSMEGRSHPKLLLRRTESVAEKMLTNWFTFLLYKFLKECAGEPLFMLFRAIKQQVDKGPVDVITSEAKYSLSEDKLIRQQIDYRVMTISVIDPDVQYGSQEHSVKVLDCDSISQVKEKILDALYKNAPFSSRPDKDDLDLEWRTGVKGRIILQDEDVTSKTEGEFKRINTLGHYKVPDFALMALVPKQSSLYNLSFGSDRSGSHHKLDTYTMSGSPSLTRPLAPQTIHLEMESGTKYYHLVKQHDTELQKEGDRGSKMVSEIYLTRLLATKGTLQQFVDDLFETIFSTTNRGTVLPLAIKYMFDFLDDQALHHGINDPEVVHTWKSNSLPLRFWVNVVKNPDFVFDVYKSNIVDACLSVTAQTFMDSCSMSEHRLGKDSPSSKLLYAKDIPKYKGWVERYYQDIKLMPAISEQDMNAMVAEESRLHQNEFNINAALYELYQYVARYNEELIDALADDEFARNYRLAQKLEQVHNCMDSVA